MSSNPLSVLVSIKTLCPEVADYWRSIPSHMKTIVDLKGYVLRDNFIDTDMDDVEFYLYDILLRGNEFIGDVLQNGDYVELRVKIATKKRISSSSEGICDRYKRTKSSFIECITVDDSNDESMSGRSCGQKVVETESISGNQLNALTEDIVNVVKNPIFDPIISQLRDIIGDNTGAVGPQWSSGSDLYLSDDLLRGNSSIGDVMRDRDRIEVRFKFADNTIGHKKPVKSKSNGSVDYRLNSRASISLATAVVTQSGDKCHTKTKAMKTITPEVRPLWPSGSGQTADKWLHTCTEPHCDYKTDSMFELNRHNLVHRMSCDLCFGRTYKTKRTLDMRYRRSHPIDPIADSVVMADNSIINESSDKVISKSESSASDVCPPNSTASISSATEVVTQWTDVWPARVSRMILTCGWPGCDYKTDNRHHLAFHRRYNHCRFMCHLCVQSSFLTSFRQSFKTEQKLAEHHRRAHPNDVPDMPWFKCTHEGCVYQTKDNEKLRKHIDKHNDNQLNLHIY